MKLESGKTSTLSKGKEQGHDDEMEEGLEEEVDELPNSNFDTSYELPEGVGGSSISNPNNIPAALMASGK
jgi:hypothetical protein